MNYFEQVVTVGLPGRDTEAETLKILTIFTGFGLLISLVCVMAFGLDLSGGLS